MKARGAVVLLLAAALLLPATTFADCSVPSGIAGDIIYNSTYNVVQFCNGTQWVNTASTVASQIGTLTNGDICTTNGTAINCTLAGAAGKVLGGVGVNFTATPTLGSSGTTGTLGFAGSTSGTVTVQPQAAAGTYNFNLPITAGNAGQVLTSQGGGSSAMTWTTAGGTVNSGTQYQLGYYATTGAAISGDANITTDASNDLLVSGGSVGIVTATPGALFTVGNNLFEVNSSGYAGVGGALNSSVPLYVTQTQSNASTPYTDANTGLYVNNTTSGGFATIKMVGAGVSASNSAITFGGTSTSDLFEIIARITTVPAITILGSGNVGIGTTSPSWKLSVNGEMSATDLHFGGGDQLLYDSGSGQTTIRTGTGGSDAYYTFTPSGQFQSVNGGGYFNGSVGIGTTAPSTNLMVYSSSGAGVAEIIGDGAASSVRSTAYQSATQGAFIELRHARGSLASPSVTLAGDFLGRLAFEGYNSSAFTNGSRIESDAEDNFSATDNGSNLIFYTVPDGTTTQTEHMRITGAGNVGIGTTSPQQALSVYSSAAFPASFNSTSTGNMSILLNSTTNHNVNVELQNAGANEWYVQNNVGLGNAFNIFSGDASGNVDAFTILQTGQVGIGATSPDSNLEVSSGGATNVSINGASANATLKFENAGTMEWQMFNDTANANSIRITNGTNGVKLNQGDTLWSSVSDARLKTGVQPLSVLDRLRNFRAVTFHWKGTEMPAATQLGVIAQEVYPLFPEVVTKGSDNPNEAVTPLSPGAWTVKYELLGVLALEGVKELAAKNAELAAKNDELAAEHITDVKAIEELSREVAELRREIHAH